MAHPKPFRIETPPRSIEDTAKKFGMSAAEVRRVRQAVQKIMQREDNGRGRGHRHGKTAARS